MPELLEYEHSAPETPSELLAPVDEDARHGSERVARNDLRDQIARLERRLGEAFAAAFPRPGIDWRVGAAGGPRVLGTGDLERVRDALVYRLREAEAELARRKRAEAANRALIEEMVASPQRHRWVRVSNRDLGEPGCLHWHSRPRWGLVGILLNWWRVKISSGCPLAGVDRAGREPAVEQA